MNVARFAIGISLVLSFAAAAAERTRQGVPNATSGPTSQRGGEAVLEPAQQTRSLTYHALIIANKNYQHLSKLETPFEDARELEKVLRENYGFKHVTVLRDATRSQIIAQLADLRTNLTSDDSLLIYYAGHGQVDKQTERGYWLAVDADRNNEANWVSNDDITNYLKAMQARQVLIVSDSCYSGTLTRDDASSTKVGGEKEWVRRMLARRARTALTSGGLEPVMDKGGKGHSAFAQAFLDVLRENDRARDTDALFQTIKQHVVTNADQTPRYAPIRLADHEWGDFVFVPVNVAMSFPPRELSPGAGLGAGDRKPATLPATPATPALPTVQGTWKNPANPMLSYVFVQQGTTVTAQEVNDESGSRTITAEGFGQMSGRMLTLTLKTVFGTGGTSVLTLSDDGQLMTGTYTDGKTKQARIITLSR